jgi:hypothetical protein
MSFHNRLLLNRAVVSGLRSLDVLLIVGATPPAGDAAATSDVSRLVAALGGHTTRSDAAIGYMRVDVPTERLVDLVSARSIAAYQIASQSRGTWYRDAPPIANAQMYRGYEVTPVAATAALPSHPELPLLSRAEADGPGFTADDAGVGQWMKDHPTFDGRGVTIALVEDALPAFDSPVLRGAKSLDGQDVAKLAGIVNVLDATETDDTRVPLDTLIDADKAWTRVGRRTFVLPHPGRYRFGLLELPAGANVVHQFGVVEELATGEVWIDANGDASFQDERVLADVNERFDPRELKLTHPRAADVSFVMGRGRDPHVVHIYLGKSSHQTMTVSVAAGSRTGGLAYGVAPNARVLLVRIASPGPALATTFEGFIAAAQRPDVDVIDASTAVSLIPDTAADFAAALLERVITVYRKPLIFSAGNTSLLLGSVHAFGSALSVGGLLAPATYAALYGGRPLESLMVHPISAAGPSLDGAVKPDFLAPMERLAADLPWNAGVDAAPRQGPTRRLPAGYQISCCTSSTSPYAAGVAALLVSAAKQSGVPYAADALSRAMRLSARLIPGVPAHQQGNGVLDVEAAWRALANPAEVARVAASAAIVHPLAQYASRGPAGTGILEVDGWPVGSRGTREITLRRESGSRQPIVCRVEWSAADGTFSSAPSVTLPLLQPVALRVLVDATSPGAHSALLTLRDDATGAIVLRSQATIVASDPFDRATGTLRVGATLSLMRQAAHYLNVPDGVGALAFDLEVKRGVVRPTIVPAHSLFPSYYMHVHPNNVHFAGAGSYHVLIPNPMPGTWTFRVDTGSTWFSIPGDPVPPDDGDAEYVLTVRLLRGHIEPLAMTRNAFPIAIGNTGARLDEPVVEVSAGALRSHKGTLRADALANLIDIAVPDHATALHLNLRSEGAADTELHLYDCTTGECFSYQIGFPAARAHTLVVRKPNAGRWVAAVNAAPFPTATGAFVLDEVLTSGTPVRHTSNGARPSGSRWREVVDELPPPSSSSDATPVLVLELLDAAAERAEAVQPWSRSPTFVKPRDRPVAAATVIYRR